MCKLIRNFTICQYLSTASGNSCGEIVQGTCFNSNGCVSKDTIKKRKKERKKERKLLMLKTRKAYNNINNLYLITAGEARTNSSVMNSYGPPHMAKQKQDVQLEHTYSSYGRIRDVTLKTCQKAMNVREKWRERVRDIRAGGTT